MEDNTNHVSGSGAIPLSSLQEFEHLFHKYYGYLCMTANAVLHDPALAEDIVQEFYISYWNKQNEIHVSAAFRTYAKRAVTNDCIDYLRRQKVMDKKSSSLEVEQDHNPEAEAELQDQTQLKYQRIVDLVAELPESRKEILILHAVERLSYAQIAEKQGVSINTVRTQLTRAYKSLRAKASLLLMAIFGKFIR